MADLHKTYCGRGERCSCDRIDNCAMEVRKPTQADRVEKILYRVRARPDWFELLASKDDRAVVMAILEAEARR